LLSKDGTPGGTAGEPNAEPRPERRLEWSVRPFREKLGRSAVVMAVIIAVGFMVVVLFKDVFLGVLSVAILVASLHTYFGRTTYRLDSDQVTVKSSFGTTAKKWSHFKRFYVDRKGVTLSPFAKPSRLEPFRSLRLLYGGNKDEVVAFVSERFGRDPGRGL
jgi:hypothetical protein